MNTEPQFARDLSDILAHVRKLVMDGDPCDFKFEKVGDRRWHAKIARENGETVTAPSGTYHTSDPDPAVALRRLAERLYD